MLELIKKLLASPDAVKSALAQHGITGVGVALIMQGVTGHDTYALVGGIALAAIGIGIAAYGQKNTAKHIDAALGLPEGTSREELEKAVKGS